MALEIEDIRGLPDFATLSKWDIAFVKAPAGVRIPKNANALCSSSDIPKRDAGQSLEAWIRGHRVRQPGITKWQDTFTVTFLETVKVEILQMIEEWREKQYNSETGVMGTRKDVEGEIRLTLLDRQNKPIFSWLVIGVYIEDYEAGGQLNDGSGDELMKPTITFSLDYAKPEKK